VTSFYYNGPRVPLGYAPVLQNTLLFCVVLYSKVRVLKPYKISLFNLSVVGFSCQSCSKLAVNQLVISEILEL